MSKIIAITNQKGGVGKTTTTLNLGSALVNFEKKVLLIDLDPQANLTTSLGFDPDELNYTITGLINNKLESFKYKVEPKYILQTNEGTDLLASDIELSGIESKMDRVLKREGILCALIQDIYVNYDYILIDCPPSLGLLTINALVASDGVIIPVQTQYFAMKGMEKLIEVISEIKSLINDRLNIMGILFTMFNKSTNLSKQVIQTIKDEYSDSIKIFESIIHSATKAAESPIFGQSIFKYYKNSEVAKDYEVLAKEVLNYE